MKRQSIILLCVFGALCLSFSTLQASKSKPFKSEEDADSYLTTHYDLGCKCYNSQDWHCAANEFEKVIYFFPDSDAAAKASYYLAICYFEMKEYDFANEEFSNYLKASQHPAFFEDAVYYKFCIAEHFKAGKRRRPFKMRYLPKWISAQDSALTIYDEVVAALPNHELTIQALYSKAELLCKMGEYRDCVETYQTIIRRFPKNEIVPVCYLNIAEAYYQQSRYEFQNPDILAFAELNVRKFKDDFPRDERVALAEQSVCRIKEMYAKGLCNLGLFYERMKKPDAAAIYYQSSIEEFPDTRVAKFCRSRLICLGYINKEEPDSCLDETISNDQEQVNEQEQPMTEERPFLAEQPSTGEQFFIAKQPFMGEQPSNCEEIPLQEYAHYSLLKKRDASHTSFESIDPLKEQALAETSIEGDVPPLDPNLDENAPYLMHYSQLKHRDQKHGAPRE
jgi:outer membrane protein assembly factor BamD (BamD/ComL family)